MVDGVTRVVVVGVSPRGGDAVDFFAKSGEGDAMYVERESERERERRQKGRQEVSVT